MSEKLEQQNCWKSRNWCYCTIIFFYFFLLVFELLIIILQELLDKAHSKEEKKLKEEKRLERALDDMFPSAKDAPNEVIHQYM